MAMDKDVKIAIKEITNMFNKATNFYRKSGLDKRIANMRNRKGNGKPSKTLEELCTWFKQEIVK